tara:strand:+ start:80 stop:553 length:474 start_codon:yes stop_codon:yes gene_type:complete
MSESYNDKLFKANDYNFTGYNYQLLELICEYKLPLRTHFPKFIAVIFKHPKFNEWLKTQNLQDLDSNKTIELLIESVKKRTENISGNLTKYELDLMNKDIWTEIVDRFFKQKDLVSNETNIDEYEEKVINKVNNKSLKNTKLRKNKSKRNKERVILI